MFRRPHNPSRPPGLQAVAVSVLGGREHNQDQARAKVLESGRNLWGLQALAAVADGMGGHHGGLAASSLAIDTVWEVLAAGPGDRAEFSASWLAATLEQVVERAVRLANNRVHATGAMQDVERTMGTTLTLLALHDGQAIIGHVGDSRAYVAQSDTLRQVTQDHSFTAEAVAEGTLSPEEAAQSPFFGQLTRAIGVRSEVRPQVLAVPFTRGMAALLCSDGLTGVVTDEDIGVALRNTSDPREAASQLVALAEAHETTDNVSIVIVDWRT